MEIVNHNVKMQDIYDFRFSSNTSNLVLLQSLEAFRNSVDIH